MSISRCIQPELHKAAHTLANMKSLRFVNVNGEVHISIRQKYGVTMYPAVKLFANGVCGMMCAVW